MAEEIKNIKLKFTCSENWNGMAKVDGGKYCDKCQKKVHDFTNSKAAEFWQILAENNYSLCGKFGAKQLPAPTIPLWKKWLSAAMVLIGFNVFTGKANAQAVKTTYTNDTAKSSSGKHTPTRTTKATPSAEFGDGIFGVLETSPKAPLNFQDFLDKNLDKRKASTPGRLTLIFVVEKDGSLSNFHAIGKYQDEGAVNETIRVFKLSPKWTPGLMLDKVVSMQYTIPINFN